MKNVIIITHEGKERRFTNFKKACRLMRLPYHYLKRFKLPKEHKGYKIERVAVE